MTNTGLQEETGAVCEVQFGLCGNTMGKQLCCMRTTMVVRDMDFMATALAGNEAPMYVLSQPSRLKLIPLLSNYYGGLCVQSVTTAL